MTGASLLSFFTPPTNIIIIEKIISDRHTTFVYQRLQGPCKIIQKPPRPKIGREGF